MSWLETLRVALLDLALHKFRSSLAVLGIIFGVASVVGMLSIGEGARRESIRHIEVLGIDNIIARSVKPAASAERTGGSAGGEGQVAIYGLLRRDLAHIRAHVPFVRYAVGMRDMRKNLYAYGGRPLDLSVMATEPEYLAITRSHIRRGRFLTWLDGTECKRVCVLGSGAARKLFSFRYPMGKTVRVGSDWYLVVGILENAAALRLAGGDDVDNCVFIPLATARARYGDISSRTVSGTTEKVKVELDAIALQLAADEAILPTAGRLERYLSKTHDAKDYELLVPRALMKQKAATQQVFSIVMGSIAGISLLIGGLGIMNIMLANVYERRREIGTRRALGARPWDILRQFLIEAATLTTLGGLVGAGVGFALTRGVSRYAGWPTVVTPVSVALGLGVSCFVGIVFGLWPAYEAARVKPIEALRSE